MFHPIIMHQQFFIYLAPVNQTPLGARLLRSMPVNVYPLGVTVVRQGDVWHWNFVVGWMSCMSKVCTLRKSLNLSIYVLFKNFLRLFCQKTPSLWKRPLSELPWMVQISSSDSPGMPAVPSLGIHIYWCTIINEMFGRTILYLTMVWGELPGSSHWPLH